MLKKLIPKSLKLKFYEMIAHFKHPRIRYGFKDGSGVYNDKIVWSDSAGFYHKESLRLADYVYIGHYTFIDATGTVEIGEGTQLGHWVGIFSHSSHRATRLYGRHFHKFQEHERKDYFIKPVRIGKYVFIGSHSMITPGVTIGDGSFIVPGTLVKKNIPPRSIVSGNPGEVTGSVDKLDERSLMQHPELQEYYYDQDFVKKIKENS